jgi:ABC-2 type transport system permease protein
MATGERLQRLTQSGWRMGLGNLLGQENGRWWRTRRWVIQSLIWTLVLGGILAGVLFSGQSDPSLGSNQLAQGLALFSILGGLFPPIAVTIHAQDALIGEKQSGTAAWVLSKPVSRAAVIVSKLVANALGVLVTMVVVPGVAAYALIGIATGHFVPPLFFVGGLAIMLVNLLFYLSLTIFLGTAFNHRGPVIGIPLALVFGFQFVLGVAPWLINVMPWGLIYSASAQTPSLAAAIFQGQAPASWLPLGCTVLWIVLFVGLAIRRYGRQEF